MAIISTELVLWNAADEYYQLQSAGRVFLASAWWLVLPYANTVAMLRVKSRSWQWFCFLLACLTVAWFSHYALNGSTMYREGAQHMHLLLAPFVHAIWASGLLCYFYFRSAIYARLRRTPERPET